MKLSIFTRILIGALLPVIAVFVIVFASINSIVNINNANNMKEGARVAVVQLTEQMTQKIYALEVLQNNISNGLASIDYSLAEAKATSDSFLVTYLQSSEDIYSTWFSFEPDLFAPGDVHFKSEYRELTEEQKQRSAFMIESLTKSGTAPDWYIEPILSGETYLNVIGRHQMAGDTTALPMLTMSSAIVKDGAPVGVVGVDLLYEDIVSFEEQKTADYPEKMMLLSTDGMVLYSDNVDDIGKSLLDFGFSTKDEIEAALHENEVWQDEIFSPFFQEKAIAVLHPFTMKNHSEVFFLYRSIPSSAINGIFDSSMEIIYITSLMGFILLAVCVFLSTRGIVVHIRRITESFHLVTKSNEEDLLGNTIPIEATNIRELDILQDSLEVMMRHLRESHTLRVKTIEAEAEKERLLDAAEIKNNFFASMSHEIRTPMNAILGISEIMLIEGGLSEEQKKHIGDIKIASDSLLGVINDILDVSKLESGDMQLVPMEFNFPLMIDNIASLAGHLASSAGLKFDLKIVGELPKCLYCDSTRMRQILINLLGNAVKYTQKGFVSLTVSVKDSTAYFEIADSGVGIKPKNLATVFEPFRRIDTRRNREVTGTGLGLSVAKSFVTLMGGTISATSEYGVGSTFSVVLPVVIGDETKLKEEVISTGTKFAEDLRVLVVDDNLVNLDVARGFLKSLHGINCITANSGLEAIAKVQEQDFDIIFMDHMMPELDGVDTTCRIRALGDKYEKIPIIALTANVVAGTKEKLLAAGLNDYISKPLRREGLQDILERWVSPEKQLGVGVIPDEKAKSVDSIQIQQKTIPDPVPASFEISDMRFLALRDIAGLDLADGLENIGQDKDMYLQTLRLLVLKIPPTLQLLSETLAEKDMKNFQVHVHGLKGALAGIGANEVSKHAKDLEIASTREDMIEYCYREFPNFNKEMTELCNKLLAALPEDETEVASNEEKTDATEAIDPSEMIEVLSRALESYDYELITQALHDMIVAEWDEEAREILNQIRTHIESFDYVGAIKLLEMIK